jgi:hypothetical protein
MPEVNNEEAWDFAVRALWENYQELRAGAEGSGLSLTPAECDRLAHNMVFPKRPAHRPRRDAPAHLLFGALADLKARLLIGGEGSSNLTLSPAECELLAHNMATPPPSPDILRNTTIAELYRRAYTRTGSSKLALYEVETALGYKPRAVFKALRAIRRW